jgi:hypothetical protein
MEAAMQRQINRSSFRWFRLATVLFALSRAEGASAQSADARIFGPSAHPRGWSYAQWSAAWWPWALELPVAAHPFIDAPDFDCSVGLADRVLYLGTAPGATVARSCDVPRGTPVGVGMANAKCSDLEGLGATEAEQRECAAFFASRIIDSALTLDGSDLSNVGRFRVASPQFSFTAPDPWIFSPAPSGAGTSVADGYFAILKPLEPGVHTLHYSGAFHFSVAEGDPFDFDAALDTTYTLIVE